MPRLRTLLALAAALLAASGAAVRAAAPHVKVIVNKELAVTKIGGDELARVYLGKKTLWDSGQRIAPAMLEDGNPSADAFLEGVLHKSSSQYRAFWKRQLFSGGGAPPRTFRTSAQVADFVARQPGAIGVVEAGFADDRVKTVQITE
jgi:ABC-type phosphate transport system substrate-binding protein